MLRRQPLIRAQQLDTEVEPYAGARLCTEEWLGHLQCGIRDYNRPPIEQVQETYVTYSLLCPGDILGREYLRTTLERAMTKYPMTFPSNLALEAHDEALVAVCTAFLTLGPCRTVEQRTARLQAIARITDKFNADWGALCPAHRVRVAKMAQYVERVSMRARLEDEPE